MSLPGVKFLGGYRQFVRRFIAGYLLLCSAILLSLLIADALLPSARVYDRIAGILRSALPRPAASAP